MDKINYKLIFVLSAIILIILSCQREYTNPWDEKANLEPEAWAPKNLQIEDISITEKRLTWEYSDENIEGFKLDRKAGDEGWQVAYQTFIKETRNWSDTDIIPESSLNYSYRLYAFAGKNNSANKSELSSTEFPEPTNLQITKNSIISVTLSWQDNSNGEDGFRIERRYEHGNWELLTNTANTSYEDTEFELNIQIYYRVCAFVEIYNSNWIENNFDATIPPPEDLELSVNSSSSLTLSWDYSSTGHEGFRIERKVNEGDWEVPYLNLNPGQLNFNDDGIDIQNNDYYYKVYAFFQNANSIKIDKAYDFACGLLIDPRDGKEYETVLIGEQCWMKQNLAYLPSVSHPENESQTLPYYYVYGYEGTNVAEAKATDNYQNYGALYNWPAALTACPGGFRLPSDEEWTQLSVFLGGVGVAGGKMKSTRSEPDPHPRWDSPNIGATNESEWSGLPGGYRFYDGFFGYIGSGGGWWSSTENSDIDAWTNSLNYENDNLYMSNLLKKYGFSIRCLKGE